VKADHRPTGELETIPGVGPSIGQDLRDLGVERVEDLAGKDPQQLFEGLCQLRGSRIDRCVLYVFRCAVYFASHPNHAPESLKWWHFKDGETGQVEIEGS